MCWISVIVDLSSESKGAYFNACSQKCHTSKLILRISWINYVLDKCHVFYCWLFKRVPCALSSLECIEGEESVPFLYTCRNSQVSECFEFEESAPFSYTCRNCQVSECSARGLWVLCECSVNALWRVCVCALWKVSECFLNVVWGVCECSLSAV